MDENDLKTLLAKEELIGLINSRLSASELTSRADVDEMSMLLEICEKLLPKRFPEILSSFEKNFRDDWEYQKSVLERLSRLADFSERYPNFPSGTGMQDMSLLPTFQLNDDDRSRVSDLCQQMRKIIFASTAFDQPHKVRLLDRIAAIENQIHREKGLFDVVRGGLEDLGETLGKFGTDSKPLVDRMKEVVGIVRKNTDAYCQLPPPEEVRRLPPPDLEE